MCRSAYPLDPAHVVHATDVVIGRIEDYQGWAFAIAVGQRLVGNAPDRIDVRWQNSTFAYPPVSGDRDYLVALRPAKYDALAEVFPGEETALWVLRQMCSPAFMIPMASRQADVVLEFLRSRH